MAEPSEKPVRILWVDDADDFRISNAELLRLEHGYDVDDVPDADQALSLARQEGQRYQVALIDEVLGGPMDGIKLMQALRVEQSQLDVILLTGYGLEPQSEALQAGAYRFLQKPVHLEQLAQMIDMCVEMQQASTELEFVQRERALLETLLELSRATGASLEQPQILQAIYEHVRRLMDASNMDIVILDRRLGQLNFVLGYDKGEIEDPWTRPFASSDDESGLTDWVIRHRAPLLLTNYPEEPTPAQPIVKGEEDTISWLGVPLLRGDRVIGAITVQSPERNRYDSTHQRILMAVANHVAQALDNARLYAELDVLNKISQRIAAVDNLDDLLEAITLEAAQLIDTRNIRCGLHRPDREEVDILIRYHNGKRQPPKTLSLNEGLTGYTIRTRRPLLLRNPQENQALKDRAGLDTVGPPSKSWLSAPLITENRVIGAIAIQDYERPDAYDERDLEILSRLANHVAVAVYKAQLLDRVQRGLRQRSTLLEITTHLRPEAELDLEWALWAFLTGVSAGYGLGFNRVMLLRWEPNPNGAAGRGWLTGWKGIGDMHAGAAEQTWIRMRARGIDSLEKFLELPPGEFDDTPVSRALQGMRLWVSSESDDGFSQAVFQGRSSVVDDRAPFPSGRPFFQTFEPTEFAVVPLKVGEQLLGVLVADNKFNGEPIDDEALGLLRSFADAVMTHLDNAQLRQELERRIDVLHRYYEVMTALRTTPDRNASLHLVAETLRDLYQLDTCTFGLLDGDGKELVFETEHLLGLPETTVRSVDKLPKKHWQRLQESDEPLVIADLSKAPEIRAVLVHPDLRSLVVLPVRDIRGELRGILTMGRRGPLTVRSEDHDNLKALAGQAGLAIHNAELFEETERRSREQEQLLVIAQRITGAVADSARNILDEIVQSAKDLTGADAVTVYPYLKRGAGSTTPRIAAVGLQSDREPQGLSGSEDKQRGAMRVVQEKGILIVENMASGWNRERTIEIPSPRKGGFRHREAIQAFAGFKLVVSDEMVGQLYVSFRRPHAFTSDELLLIESFAAHAAIALQKHLLMHRVERLLTSQISAIDGLQRVEELVSLLDSPLEEVRQVIVKTAVAVSHADRGWFLEVDDKTGDLLRKEIVNVPQDRLRQQANRPKLGQIGITGRVAELKITARVNDVENDPEWSKWYLEAVSGTGSEMAVPILLGPDRELVGVIDLESDRKNAFDEDAQRLVEALAAAAAVAHQNATLYRQAARRQGYLQAQIKAARAISASLDLDTILDRILQEAVNLTEIEGQRAHFGVILLYQDDALVFTQVYPHEELADLNAAIGDRIPLPEGILLPDGTRRKGISGRVALTRQSECVPDVEKDGDYLGYSRHTRSELAVPLLAGERLIGVLNVEHQGIYVFDDEDIRALEALAEQAVIAILNAETYAELEKQRRELEEKKDELAASTAVAWTGILGSTLIHDLQGYVSAIRKALEEIEYTIPVAPLREAISFPIEDMMNATDRIQELAGQLRLSPEDRPDRVNLHALLTERVADWQKMYRRDQVEWILQPDPTVPSPQVEVNRLALISALDKVVDNAVVAMRGRQERRLTIHTRAAERRIEIDFVDTGPGVPEEIRDKLFKEQLVKKSDQEGGGIGGLIVNLIARASKGGVRLAETGPQGTTVTLCLPLEV